MQSLFAAVRTRGSVNRTAVIPAFLRTPAVIQPHLDMKPFLQFPLETAAPHSVGLLHSFSPVRVSGEAWVSDLLQKPEDLWFSHSMLEF
ncbi:zinc finger protein 385A isoform X1 [Arapaima gigas]